ncbi:MAG TPA: hypothetical protein VKH40_16190, partial [Alloacidobacterium sp.]|nr:hypothetical protein [Alloacidobacterium sp.]
KMAHSGQRALKCLVLVTGAPVCRLGEEDEFLSSFEGPVALVSTVTKVLQAAPANSSLKRRLMAISDSILKVG